MRIEETPMMPIMKCITNASAGTISWKLSGLARLLQLLGVSILVVIAIDVTEAVVAGLLDAAAHPLLGVALATILRERTTAVSVTGIVIMTGTVATLATVLAARILVTAIVMTAMIVTDARMEQTAMTAKPSTALRPSTMTWTSRIERYPLRSELRSHDFFQVQGKFILYAGFGLPGSDCGS
jgi:hypothetical protein